MKTGCVFDIKELTLYEGNGLNIAIFLKGCDLNCIWCHNPEGIKKGITKYGETNIGCIYNSENLAKKLKQYIKIQNHIGGYFIFSGGEPLNQTDFIIEVIEKMNDGMFALDTSGYADKETFYAILPKINMFYFDIKLYEDKLHMQYTGVSNKKILKNLEILAVENKPVIIRIPLIPGITDNRKNLDNIAQYIRGMPNIIRVELMTYNPFTKYKYDSFGIDFRYKIKTPNILDTSMFIKNNIQCEILEI